MRDRLIDHVRGLFSGAADTPRNRELEEEILQNTLDRYDDLLAQGVSEEEAYSQAAANIGNVRNLLEQPSEPAHAPQTRPKKKRRIGWIIAGVVILFLLAQLALLGLNFASRGGVERLENAIEQRVEAITDPVEHWADNVEDALEGDVPGRGDGFAEKPGANNGASEVDAGNITALDIDWTAGNVLVEVGDGDKISIAETGGQEEPLVWSEKNGVLSIDFRKEGIYLTALDKDLTVQLPAALAQSLSSIRVSSVSADVTVDDLSLRSLSMTSVSGNLTADVVCREFRTDTTSGSVTFNGSARDMEVDTVSGTISITSAETPDEISVDTTSGSLVLTIPADRSFEAEFDTVSGYYTCEHQAPVRDEVRYVGTLSCEPAEFEFDTVSGNVEILKY